MAQTAAIAPANEARLSTFLSRVMSTSTGAAALLFLLLLRASNR